MLSQTITISNYNITSNTLDPTPNTYDLDELVLPSGTLNVNKIHGTHIPSIKNVTIDKKVSLLHDISIFNFSNTEESGEVEITIDNNTYPGHIVRISFIPNSNVTNLKINDTIIIQPNEFITLLIYTGSVWKKIHLE